MSAGLLPDSVNFVLDQNFPYKSSAVDWPTQIQVEPLARLDRWLTGNTEDWEILIDLHFRGDVDGFITNDVRILESPREMVALSLTKLVLVACGGIAGDPLKATGLVMLHLGDIARAMSKSTTAWTWLLRPTSTDRKTPGQRVDSIATKRGVPANELTLFELRAIETVVGAAAYQKLRAPRG